MTLRAARVIAAALILSYPMWAAPRDLVESVHLDLNVRIDPSTRALRAHAELTCECAGAVKLTLGNPFTADEIIVDGAPLTGAHSTSHEEQHWLVDLPAHKARHLMQIRYRGELAPLLQADERGVLAALPPMASERGTYLPGGSGWYPELGVDVFSYRVTLDLPVAQRGLVPGRLLSER